MLAPPPAAPPSRRAAGEKSEPNDFLLLFGRKIVALLFCVDGERTTKTTCFDQREQRTSSFDGESDFDDDLGPFVQGTRVDGDVDTDDDDDDAAEPSAGSTPRRGDDEGGEEAAVSVASAVRAARALSDGRPVEFDGAVHSPPSSPCRPPPRVDDAG